MLFLHRRHPGCHTAATTTYTATATGAGGNVTATATVTVSPAGSVAQIDHVIFMMQENHSFDNYLGMLNPYRKDPLGTGTCPNNAAGVPQCYNVGDDGNTYNVDGIDDKLTTISDTSDSNPPNSEPPSVKFNLFKLTSTCIDDDSSAWLSSFGDVNRYDNAVDRPIQMNGFVHTAQGYANSCNASGNCVGDVGDVFTDTLGARAMGYYDQAVFQLLLLHGIAVRALRPLVLAHCQQDHRQPHRHLHRRHNARPGAGS